MTGEELSGVTAAGGRLFSNVNDPVTNLERLLKNRRYSFRRQLDG